ncbi:MAG: response regulator transcription factor [Bryobacteraceae bacterium]
MTGKNYPNPRGGTLLRVGLYASDPMSAPRFLSLLLDVDGFEIAGMWNDMSVLPKAAAAARTDVMLVDADASDVLPLVTDISTAAPNCRVVLWGNILPELAVRAIRIGVRGVLCKTTTCGRFVECLHHVACGEVFLDDELALDAPWQETVRLTDRESQLLELLECGMKNREIASALSISEGTVKVYLSRLFQKAGVRDRYQNGIRGARASQGAKLPKVDGNGSSVPPSIPRRGSRATPWIRSLSFSPSSSTQD